MSNPLISCIVPVYNGERYLREALDSIVAQSYRPIEIIVVDDGSTDGSADLAAKYSHPVRLFRQENAGPASARNHGIRHAAGEFIAFLDADDLWLSDKLERQMDCFRLRPELGYCVTLIQNFWVPELEAEREKFQGTKLAEPVAGYTAPTLLARAAAFAAVGDFRESMSHTNVADWFTRARELGLIGELLSAVLLMRRLHQTNRSRLRNSISADEYLRFLKTRLDQKRLTPDAHG